MSKILKGIGGTILGLAVLGTATYFAVPKIANKSWQEIFNPPAQEETQKPGDTENPGETETPGDTDNPGETENPGEGDVEIPPRDDEQPHEIVFSDVSYNDETNILKISSPNVPCDLRVQLLDGTGETFAMAEGESLEIDVSSIVSTPGTHDVLIFATSDLNGGLFSSIQMISINIPLAEFPLTYSLDEYGYLNIESNYSGEGSVYLKYEIFNEDGSRLKNSYFNNTKSNRIFDSSIEPGNYIVKLYEMGDGETFELKNSEFEYSWTGQTSFLDNFDLGTCFNYQFITTSGITCQAHFSTNGSSSSGLAYAVRFTLSGYDKLDSLVDSTSKFYVKNQSYNEETSLWTIEVGKDICNQSDIKILIEYYSLDNFFVSFYLPDGEVVIASAYTPEV